MKLHSDSGHKNKSVTIKKMHPKSSFRKNVKKTGQQQNTLKFNHMNMHGFDITEEYHNHSSITL